MKDWKPLIVYAIDMLIEASKDKVVLVRATSAPGDDSKTLIGDGIMIKGMSLTKAVSFWTR